MSHEPCRVAVITGGARGIGYATADVLARDGHAVVIADIDRGAGEDAAERLRAAGRSALSVPTDVADRASVEAMVRTLLERLGRIDVLVNNEIGRAQSELQSQSNLVCRLLLEKKKKNA